MRSFHALPFRSGRTDARPTRWPPPALALAALAVLAVTVPAHGQTEVVAPRPDPLDARAPVPPVVHRPALSSYRPAGELTLGSWREANDIVTRIGGWRAYTREANQPESPAAAPAAPQAAPAAPPAPPAPGHHGRHEPK